MAHRAAPYQNPAARNVLADPNMTIDQNMTTDQNTTIAGHVPPNGNGDGPEHDDNDGAYDDDTTYGEPTIGSVTNFGIINDGDGDLCQLDWTDRLVQRLMA